MGAEPGKHPRWERRIALSAVVLAAVVGLALLADSARSISATYDETAYLQIGARWWRTGDQAEITRMGSPLTFWKWQQAPTLAVLDLRGRGGLIDRATTEPAVLLPILRLGSLGFWLAGLAITAGWAWAAYGPRASAAAAWLYALSPNLLAHGALITMESPLVTATAAVVFLFWRFLETGRRGVFWASAVACGMAFSFKFTAVIYPVLLGCIWLTYELTEAYAFARVLRRVVLGMIGFVVVMVGVNLTTTVFALMTPSPTSGGDHPSLAGLERRSPTAAKVVARLMETPIPQDWVGFATQMRHQRSGGPSYLMGDRRMTGWWYYYFVAMAVKVPFGFSLLAAARVVMRLGSSPRRLGILPLFMAMFLAATALGSSRNYGYRYVLPLAPLAIVWVSGAATTRRGLIAAAVALLIQAAAVASVHPDELTYFNALAGGRLGGRRVLADSNLDWGQGLLSLVELQRENPAMRDLTLYYFGDVDPRLYGVGGEIHVVDAGEVHPGLPDRLEAKTRFVAVSASLQWGPWGPPGYFRRLDGVAPVAMTRDTTIAIYRAEDLRPDQ